MREQCDVCKKGTITYSKPRRAIDGDGMCIEYREVNCSNKKCVIHKGMKL